MESARTGAESPGLWMVTLSGRRQAVVRLICLPVVGLAMPGAARAGESGTVRRRIRSTLGLRNPYGKVLERQVLWCYLPMNDGMRQRLVNLDLAAGHRLLSDAYGHLILQLEFATFPAFGFSTIPIATTVELAEPPARPALADAAAWLKSERFIESDAPDLVQLAHSLRRSTHLDTGRAVYEWVSTNIAYAGYLADDLGALYAFRRGRGDCTEYANLVVALARANGLPARMVGGYVMDRDSVTSPEAYHNWAELFLDGAWRIVDAQKGAWLAPPSTYIAYRIYRDRAVNAIGNAHRFRVAGELQVKF